MGKFQDLTGKRFTRLIVVSRVASHKVRWLCRCDCGQETVVASQCLRTKHVMSCGCLQRDAVNNFRTHGMSRTREYALYRGMLNRCHNPKVKSFERYGGAGIIVADRWRYGEAGRGGFECFFQDLGPRPSDRHSLDRIDPKQGYEPSNVRWALPLEQANNKTRTRWVIYRGTRMSLMDAVRAAGSIVHREAAAIRIRTGWPVEKAVEIPTFRAKPYHGRRLRGRALVALQRLVAERDGTACWYCSGPDARTLDHVVPLSRGGTDDLSNLRIACLSCNASKGGLLESEWLPRRGPSAPVGAAQ